MRVITQYRHGFSGPTGLDYSAVYPLLDRMKLSPAEWDRHLDDLRVMEASALNTMRERTQ